MFPLFNVLLAPFVPALWLYTLHRRFVQKKSAASFHGQWGKVSPAMREFGRQNGPKIWLHAVSVGETMAAKPIARALKNEIEGVQIALSSTTDTGHEIAESLLKNGEVDCAFYFALDLAPVQNRVLSALAPDAILFIETELWPNLLHLARRQSIPTFLVNGRVSDNLLKTAPKIGPIWRWMSGNISIFLMRGEDDAARLISLGVAPQKIKVTGDVKLEAPPISSEELRKVWRERLGLIENDKVLICGSTHAGEEEIFLRLAPKLTGWKIAFAPRHPNRFDEVAQLAEQAGFDVITRSSHKKWKPNSIFLLDSVGELGDFYALGDAAFVGGSLVSRGGHNLLEPILRGVPVVFGPFVHNFLAQRDLILQHQLGVQLQTETEIAAWLNALDFNRADFAQRVETALETHRGAAAKMARIIDEAIAKSRG
ncbi:3-deoxy-D-manno-octulosonic-acid transferase [Abditibacterium utsteinense]|uniref:3-deoxy-D-manno-octulosonic acid transferase n=1 Tax=Abditibacterium utsteinense TaxID=1960156 RepID=A0A2S8SX19_9BACT|nr:glycosyltransferase N-terminal domain-containing protein [Abditibacterium utsteinense]PQV65350.1 3-deoxy-D-manno-octulosonic-acid transferase [Abditibacterium utsteinense]